MYLKRSDLTQTRNILSCKRWKRDQCKCKCRKTHNTKVFIFENTCSTCRCNITVVSHMLSETVTLEPVLYQLYIWIHMWLGFYCTLYTTSASRNRSCKSRLCIKYSFSTCILPNYWWHELKKWTFWRHQYPGLENCCLKAIYGDGTRTSLCYTVCRSNRRYFRLLSWWN